MLNVTNKPFMLSDIMDGFLEQKAIIKTLIEPLVSWMIMILLQEKVCKGAKWAWLQTQQWV